MDKLFYDQLCAKEVKYQKLLDAIRVLKDELLSESSDVQVVSTTPMHAYIENSIQEFSKSSEFLNYSVDNKVLNSLKAIKRGNITEIVNSWKRHEENVDEEYARSKVKQWVHSLSLRGDIEVIERGAGKRSGIYGYIDKETADNL